MRAFAFVALIAAGASSSAQPSKCSLVDPNQPGCAQASTPGPSIPPTPVPPLSRESVPGVGRYPNGVAPLDASGRRECATFDTVAKRCLAFKNTPEEYESAIQTGIRAAHSAMGIQQDIQQRVMGVPHGAEPLPSLPTGHTNVTAPGTADNTSASAACRQGYLQGVASTGRPVTKTDHTAAGRKCGK